MWRLEWYEHVSRWYETGWYKTTLVQKTWYLFQDTQRIYQWSRTEISRKWFNSWKQNYSNKLNNWCAALFAQTHFEWMHANIFSCIFYKAHASCLSTLKLITFQPHAFITFSAGASDFFFLCMWVCCFQLLNFNWLPKCNVCTSCMYVLMVW